MASDGYALSTKGRVVEKEIGGFALVGSTYQIIAFICFNDLQPRRIGVGVNFVSFHVTNAEVLIRHQHAIAR